MPIQKPATDARAPEPVSDLKQKAEVLVDAALALPQAKKAVDK